MKTRHPVHRRQRLLIEKGWKFVIGIVEPGRPIELVLKMQRLNPEIPIERVWKFGPQSIIDGIDDEFHISIGNAPSEDAKTE